ncbi:sensor histidine kinase [Streptomyces sp. N50]|uniref:sensor histidine kinase n=1 Tax=Streptomyces sp. N50 TaxID=3081765 RepID=UPI00296252B0|nr:ATP-binding protein [Streptomyces sp. N50]WOX13771.1 ATP-binding protein [Streptomyces sp. N50]
MPADTAEPGPRGGALRHDRSPDAGRVASLGLATPQDVFGLRRSAQQAAAAVALDHQDQVRLATALSELGRDRLGCRGLEVAFGLDATAQPMALVITFVWIGGPPPARDTLDLAAKLVRVDHEAGSAVSRIVVTQPLTAPGLTAADLRARLVKALADGARSTEADDLRAQTRDLVAALEETRAQREELLHLNEELEETNRGVLALYSELTQELETTNSGVLALHSELEDKRHQLLAASEAKTRFWTNISHELRTPVNSVVALSALLLATGSPPLTEEQREQVDLIASSGHTLLSLVNDLLDVAKAEAGHLDIHPQPVDLRLLFAHLGSLLMSSSHHDQVTLVTPGLEQQPALVTDETLLIRILRNLLSNALKFTERGEVRLDVAVDPELSPHAVLFTVTDTGVGIPADELGRVFEAFYQVRGPHQRGHPGTGLGLPYARTLTELLGGSLTLTSTAGVGTRVQVRLPDLGREPAKEPDTGGSGHDR